MKAIKLVMVTLHSQTRHLAALHQSCINTKNDGMNVFATLGTRGFARVRHPGDVFAQLIIFRLSKCQTKRI